MANVTMTAVANSGQVALPRPDDPCLQADGRTELKYCVPSPIADAALAVAGAHLPHDPMALGPRQQITSLYLDTAQLTFLRLHRERAADRFKLRIRRYGDHPVPTLYAEVKRKTGSVVRKRRAAFPRDALHFVLESPEMPDAESSRDRTGDLMEFVRHRSQCGAAPTMLVTCLRESLRGPREATAVTVDRDLRYQPTCRGDLAGDDRAWQPIPLPAVSRHGTALVELKYGLYAPPWMEGLIGQLAPWRVSFSKYATAMNASVPAGC